MGECVIYRGHLCEVRAAPTSVTQEYGLMVNGRLIRAAASDVQKISPITADTLSALLAWAQSIDTDGTPAQVGPTADDLRRLYWQLLATLKASRHPVASDGEAKRPNQKPIEGEG